MLFTETALKGAYLIDVERLSDARGSFSSIFSQQEFAAHGLKATIALASIVSSPMRGTIRGLHFQYPPAAQAKLVGCIRGAVFDVIVDLRPESSTYLQHLALDLNEEQPRFLYVPERFAHGYQVLHDGTETIYFAAEPYTPALEGGLRYDDARLAIAWPLPVTVISERDGAWKPLDGIESEVRRRMRLGTRP